MKGRFNSIVLLTLALSWTALAQMQSPMREGSWEITMKMSMPGRGMEMPPIKQTQCVTAAMVKDPQGSLPKGPDGGDCKFIDYKFTGSTASYKMVCTKPAPVTAVAEMKFTGTDAYTGTMSIDSKGQTVSMTYDAKRLGDCPK